MYSKYTVNILGSKQRKAKACEWRGNRNERKGPGLPYIKTSVELWL